jgi:hypothetical protein
VSHISLYFQQPNFNIAFVFNVKEDMNLTFQIHESEKKNESNKRTLSKEKHYIIKKNTLCSPNKCAESFEEKESQNTRDIIYLKKSKTVNLNV